MSTQNKLTDEEKERIDGEKAWRDKQAMVTRDLRQALERYTRFHEVEFESWFEEWRKFRRIK